jgi:transposase
VRQIDAIFAIEREINGLAAEQRLAVRTTRIAPLVSELESWMRNELARLSRHADVAKAMDYMLKRWAAFTRFFSNGRICLTNNAAERALRGIATRRSLCPPSSSLWKHWNLIFSIGAIRATFSPERGSDPLVLQVAGADLVRSARHHLLGREDTILNQAAYLVIGDTKFAGGLGHCQPFASLLGRTVGVNAVHPAH